MDQGLIGRVRVRGQLGFTLIEMMITVAVIAILALVVVPQFFKESRKTKSASEIHPMFAEISIREEQYKVDNGAYLTAPTCPASPSSTGVAASTCAADWATLRINPPESTVRCSYEITVGTTAGTNNPGGFNFTSPAFDWYYILATCDMDGNSARDSTYFTSSMDSQIQKLDEGY